MNKNLRALTALTAMVALLAACGDEAPTEPASTTTAPTPTAALAGADTKEVSQESDTFGQLVGVRVGQHPGFDRVVLEFSDGVPGYTVKYVDLPVIADGSGDPIDLPGADFAVQIVMSPASGFDMDAGVPTYKGPKTVTNDKTAEITSAVSSGDFESQLSWAIGLHHKVPFKVTQLTSPDRLVIDFQAG